LQTNKNIGGYKCQEAKTRLGGRSFTAWYTTEIPLSDGPYKFQGLPGLILEAYDDTKEHHFLMVSLSKTTVNYNPQHRNVVTADMKEIKKARENQVENIRNSGFTVSTELLKKAKDKLSKQNNHIEKIE
jgi:GLPGLI family protein